MVEADVNGRAVSFLVDTGAALVILSRDDASRVGIVPAPDQVRVIGRGASGPVSGEPVVLDQVTLNGKTVQKVQAAVVDDVPVSLLGESFLSRAGNFELVGGQNDAP